MLRLLPSPYVLLLLPAERHLLFQSVNLRLLQNVQEWGLRRGNVLVLSLDRTDESHPFPLLAHDLRFLSEDDSTWSNAD